MMNEEIEIMSEEKKKDLLVSNAFVTIKNCVLLAECYIENRDELSEFTPLCQIIDDIQGALKSVQPYYEELDCVK